MTVTLLHGDALEMLPALTGIDACIADPPYGVNFRQGNTGHRRWHTRFHNTPIAGDGIEFDPSPLLSFPLVVLFGANNFANRLPPSRGWIFWHKRAGMKANDFGDGELIYTNQDRSIRYFEHMWNGVLRASERDELHYHPMQKPISLMCWLIEQYTQPGDTVLDPYMGSGTTGVACIKTGRNFIGIEISEEYFNVAQKRIHDAAAQPMLFEVNT